MGLIIAVRRLGCQVVCAAVLPCCTPVSVAWKRKRRLEQDREQRKLSAWVPPSLRKGWAMGIRQWTWNRNTNGGGTRTRKEDGRVKGGNYKVTGDVVLVPTYLACLTTCLTQVGGT